MGFLTTFTIYSDGIDQIKKDSKELCEKLYLAAISGKVQDIAHGNHCNLIKVQKTRHADDHTIYVHQGNTLCEMNAWGDETEELMKSFPEYFEAMLSTMEFNTRKLREKLNNFKVEKLKEKKNVSDS